MSLSELDNYVKLSQNLFSNSPRAESNMYYIFISHIAVPFICQIQPGNLLTFIAYVEIKTERRINDRLH